ncbi:hypothetical protein [Dyella sp.]|jgi:chorismate-pyruvate lyase|uniref:hypothetical protein n=1 Tax=Dyella sp. TaxID=1869338 RepID=UPI002D77078E|nr:hypothetical protein [Dyella sp.]HET6431145.1 hypothetical protein [Dyella sp.]
MALATALAAGASASPPAPAWPDTALARTEALALLQTLNADLLSHDSATLTLERWCGAHGMASPARVIAEHARGAARPLPDDLRAQLGLPADAPVAYRRVALRCGGHTLSEAENWYVPSRLTAAMNRTLERTDAPFGKVVQSLHFRRRTLSAVLLWAPLPAGWERAPRLPADRAGALAIPDRVLQHRAVLVDGEGRPFSALIETYTGQVLAFTPPSPPAGEQRAR